MQWGCPSNERAKKADVIDVFGFLLLQNRKERMYNKSRKSEITTRMKKVRSAARARHRPLA